MHQNAYTFNKGDNRGKNFVIMLKIKVNSNRATAEEGIAGLFTCDNNKLGKILFKE